MAHTPIHHRHGDDQMHACHVTFSNGLSGISRVNVWHLTLFAPAIEGLHSHHIAFENPGQASQGFISVS